MGCRWRGGGRGSKRSRVDSIHALFESMISTNNSFLANVPEAFVPACARKRRGLYCFIPYFLRFLSSAFASIPFSNSAFTLCLKVYSRETTRFPWTYLKLCTGMCQEASNDFAASYPTFFVLTLSRIQIFWLVLILYFTSPYFNRDESFRS